MMISLTLKEIEKFKDLLENNVSAIRKDMEAKDVHRNIADAMVEPLEEMEKLIAYLDSKIPEQY